MTGEDFFSFTEMKDGLSSLARVEELVSVIQKKKDCVLSDVVDAATQWVTVSRILAATENKEYLNHFVQLNGLSFLNQWLREAQKCSNDVCDNVMVELISTLLLLLEKLPINSEKANASGLAITLEQLLGNNNIKIKEKARILYDKWNHANDAAIGCHNSREGGTLPYAQPKLSVSPNAISEGICSGHPAADISTCEGGIDGDGGEIESAGTELPDSNVARCLDSFHPDNNSEGRTLISNQMMSTTSNSDAHAVLSDVNSSGSSLVSNSCQENLSVTEESSVCPASALASFGPSSSQVDSGRDEQGTAAHRDVSDGPKEMETDIAKGSPPKSSEKELCIFSLLPGLSASVPAPKAGVGSNPSCNLDSKKSRSCALKTLEPRPVTNGADCAMPKCSETTEESDLAADGSNHLNDLSGNVCIPRKITGDETTCHRKEALGSKSVFKNLGYVASFKFSRGVDPVIPSDFLRTVEAKATWKLDQKSEFGLEYGEIDALEVARQVAIEVEREVVDCREPFCSSPEVNSGETSRAHISDFEHKQDEAITGDPDKLPSGENDHSGSASSPKEDGSGITENISSGPKNPVQDVESPKSESAAQILVGKADRGRCDFDLNANICPEEFDSLLKSIPSVPVNVSAPIAVVAASKGPPGLPATPLHFEGEMGWKGSAATSAFRPASPRRTPNNEKAYSDVKHKLNFLGFDLNVAEGGDDVVEPVSVKLDRSSPCLPSGDSSMEVSSRRAERLKLDLNRLGDEDASTNPSSFSKPHAQNGEQSLSSASSSFSRQPAVRDFDLNDNPSVLDAGGSHDLDKSFSEAYATYGGSKLDDPVTTITGSRMIVDRKDYANHAQHSFLGNGLKMDSMVAAGSVLPYAHMASPAYGYSGLSMGSATPAFYGPQSVPYMVDSRGAIVIPHVMSSAGPNSMPGTRPPFLMSLANAPSFPNGFGSFRPVLDLNSGMAPTDGGSREASGSFKQLLLPAHSSLMEEQTMTASQLSSSRMTLKRKEPDSGWELFANGYKR